MIFGGQLTALRYPEREIDTRLKPKITIREENAIAALEMMSRFASDPKWLIYLPPTMSPTETSKRANLLEHPDEAFSFYRKEGIATVVCEQKHMGSRAVVVLCKDEAVSQKRFGVVQASLGTVYTRTGRRFFTDEALDHQFLARLQSAVERSGLWDDLATDWLCLDCELMPWSAKAQELLQKQYAPVGNAGVYALRAESDSSRRLRCTYRAWNRSLHKPLIDSVLSSITPRPISNTAGRSVR
jgi:protein phosphatase